jgi:hypothetical protein
LTPAERYKRLFGASVPSADASRGYNEHDIEVDDEEGDGVMDLTSARGDSGDAVSIFDYLFDEVPDDELQTSHASSDGNCCLLM